jgi:hypothetical protein
MIDCFQLSDTVSFEKDGKPYTAYGRFAVFAYSRKHAEITARLHLCVMLKEAGLLTFERKTEE